MSMGTNLIRLTDDAANDSNPAWSPDGAWLAFESDRGGTSDIWIMRHDGSDAQNLSDGSSDDSFPSWGQ
jgi:TolB protein